MVGANLAAFRDRTNYEPARSLRPGLVGVNLGKNKVLPGCQQATPCMLELPSSQPALSPAGGRGSSM